VRARDWHEEVIKQKRAGIYYVFTGQKGSLLKRRNSDPQGKNDGENMRSQGVTEAGTERNETGREGDFEFLTSIKKKKKLLGKRWRSLKRGEKRKLVV